MTKITFNTISQNGWKCGLEVDGSGANRYTIIGPYTTGREYRRE